MGGDSRPERHVPLRLHAALVVAFWLVTACADDADPVAGPSTTAPSTSTSSTTAEPTPSAPATTVLVTTTAEPPPACPDDLPIRELDIDGDGIDEGVWLTERTEGQRLRVCGPASDRALDLEYAAWYVAVTDVEPNGIDELFLGAAELDDQPDRPGTILRWLDPADGGLAARTAEFSGLSLGSRAGGGCVDTDGDGVRELVQLQLDDETSTELVVGWRRGVSNVLPWQDAGQDRTGTFDRVSDASEVELLTTFSCGDEVVPLTRVAPPAAICDADDRYGFEADPIDLDGDGRSDRVVQQEARGDATLRGADFGGPAVTVCLGSGANDQLPVGGQGEVFDVDEGPDGHALIWTGGTSVSAAFFGALVVVDGRLVYVDDAANEFGFGLWDGAELWDDAPRYGASGCDDVDGDGEEEFTQIEAEVDGDVLAWTLETWAFDGRTATPGPTTTGTVALPVDFDQGIDGYGLIADLTVDTC